MILYDLDLKNDLLTSIHLNPCLNLVLIQLNDNIVFFKFRIRCPCKGTLENSTDLIKYLQN